MPHTYSTIWLHIVFAAKNRQPLIHEEWSHRLYDYMGGIVRDRGATLYGMGGMEDHVHMLINTKTYTRIDYLMRDVKAEFSGWLHRERISYTFQWQKGYGAFSVSESQIEKVKHYISNQREHHKTRTFEDEFKLLLKTHNIQFDEKYLWS